MRKAAKRDSNERGIIEVAEALGASVVQVNQENLPDLLVGFSHLLTGVKMNLLVEVKSQTGKLTTGQQKFFHDWTGQKAVVRSSEEMFVLVWKEMGWNNVLKNSNGCLTKKYEDDKRQKSVFGN